MKTSTTGLRLPEARAFRELLIAVLVGCVTAVAAAQTPTTYEVVHAFRNSGQIAYLLDPRGVLYGATQSALIQAADGYLYGTSYWGGTNGVGTIFRIDSVGNVSTVHSFAYADGANPAAGLVQGVDGNLYGTATRGGANNLGTVFRMDSSGHVIRLHSFDGAGGKDPRAALIQAIDGNLYGTTESGGDSDRGTIYKINASGTLTTLHSFAEGNGGAPAALVQGTDGSLYGTTEGSDGGVGTVYKLDTSGTFSTIHNFSGPDGSNPCASLVQASDGFFYGTTRFGGDHAWGVIFRIDTSGAFTVLHSFDPSSDGALPYAPLIQAEDAYLYGTTSRGASEYDAGTVYRIDTTGNLTVIHRFSETGDVSSQSAVLQAADGNLYGTTTTALKCVLNQCQFVAGTVFRMDVSGQATVLHSFGWTDGSQPQSALTQAVDGRFYGTTFYGGTNDLGAIFRLNPSGSADLLYSFDGSKGGLPRRVIQATDGFVYGSSTAGGQNGSGTFFRLDADSQITSLHDFEGVNGFPSDLIQATDGNFYGTTMGGGAGWGSAFRLDSAGGFTQLKALDPSLDGAFPSSLVEGFPGWFFGTAMQGGADGGLGTLFRMDGSGNIDVLHVFQGGPDGGYPTAPPTYLGSLYGTTIEGGEHDGGTVFAYDFMNFEAIYNFASGEPVGALVAGLYGATRYDGTNAQGTIFRLSEGAFTVVHGFAGLDGRSPNGSLIEAADGFQYGTAAGGGPFGEGVVFRITDSAIAANELAPSSGPASGGTAVDVLGGGFTTGATVAVGGIAGTDVTVLDPTFLYLYTPALSPGTLNDVTVTNSGSSTASATHPKAFLADFLDVPQSNPFHDFIEKIFRAGITAGCGGGSYCPDSAVTRAQMAAFLLKAEHGSSYAPPACHGVFGDVSCPSLFADWIEQLATEGITAGCGGGNYCPSTPVTRAQMAVFLLKAEHGSAYAPPSCTGVFGDVSCPSLFADWIEQLAAEGITAGCGGGNYCPGNSNTRGQMAVFLVKTFHL